MEPGSRRATGVIHMAGQGLGEPTSVHARAGNQPDLRGRLRHIDARTYGIEFDAPGSSQGSLTSSRAEWSVEVNFSGEGGAVAVPVRAPAEMPSEAAESDVGGVVWTPTRSGQLALTGGPMLEVTGFVSRVDCFELVIRHSGITTTELDAMALVAGHVELSLLERTELIEAPP